MPKFDPDKKYGDFTEITDASIETIIEAIKVCGEQMKGHDIPIEDDWTVQDKMEWHIMTPPAPSKADGSHLGFVSWKYKPK